MSGAAASPCAHPTLRGQDRGRPVALAKRVLAVLLQVQSWARAPVSFRKKHLGLVHTESDIGCPSS